MSGDVHVRFCESRGVRFPPATRLPLPFMEFAREERIHARILFQQFDSKAFAPADAQMQSTQLSALYTLQHRLARDTEADCVASEHRHPACRSTSSTKRELAAHR